MLNKVDDILLKTFKIHHLLLRHSIDVIQRIYWTNKAIDSKRHCAILDVGCGSGIFGFYLADKGHDVTMIDRSEFTKKIEGRINILKNYIKGSVKFIGYDIRRLGFLGFTNHFDYIICTEVIEHIRDDKQLMSDMAGMLKKAGILILTTPYKHSRHLYGDKISEEEDGDHVRWGYDLSELCTLCEKNGLEVVYNGFLTGYMAQKLMNITRIVDKQVGNLAIFLTYPFRIFVLLDDCISKIFRYPYLSIAIKAKKY